MYVHWSTIFYLHTLLTEVLVVRSNCVNQLNLSDLWQENGGHHSEHITEYLFVTKYLSLNISPHPLIFQRPNETINYWTVRVTVPTLRASGDVLFNCHVNSTRYLDRFNQLSKNIQIYIKLPVAGQLAVESRSRRSIKFKFPFSTNFPCCHHHISVQLLCSYDI